MTGFTKKPRLLMPILMAAMALTACGGDDGGGDAPDDSDKPAAIQGAAVKGIIKNAEVVAYATHKGRVVGKPIFNGTTDDEGKYDFDAPEDHTGPIIIQIVNPKKGGATIVCDVPTGCGNKRFGQETALDKVKLEVIIADVQANERISGSVTPLTHMAAALARGLGLTNTNIDTANAKVAALFGLSNILNTTPPDITSSKSLQDNKSAEAVKHALLASAVAAMAESDFDGNLVNTINTLAVQYRDFGGELIANEVNNNTNTISVVELTRAARATASHINTLDGFPNVPAATTSALAMLELEMSQREAGTLTQTPGISTAGTSKLNKAKTLVQDLRNWGNVLGGQTSVFNDRINTTVDDMSNSTDILTRALGQTFDAVTEGYATGYTNTALTFYLPGIATAGTIQDTGAEIVVQGGVVNVEQNGTTYPIEVDLRLLDPENTVGTTLTFEIIGLRVAGEEDGDGDLTVGKLNGSGSISAEYASSYNFDTEYNTRPFRVNPDSIHIDLDAQLRDADYSLAFSGIARFDLTYQSSGDTYGIEHFHLAGAVRDGSSNINLSYSVNMDAPHDRDYLNTNSNPGDSALGVTLQLAGMPTATVYAELNITNKQNHSGSISIHYDSRVLEVEASRSSGHNELSFDVTNSDGAKMAVTSDDGSYALGELTYNGITYGTVRDTQGLHIITYSDGSFESF